MYALSIIYLALINHLQGQRKHLYNYQHSEPKITIIKVENSEHKTKNQNKNLFYVSECLILILLHLLQYKLNKIHFKSPPPP